MSVVASISKCSRWKYSLAQVVCNSNWHYQYGLKKVAYEITMALPTIIKNIANLLELCQHQAYLRSMGLNQIKHFMVTAALGTSQISSFSGSNNQGQKCLKNNSTS